MNEQTEVSATATLETGRAVLPVVDLRSDTVTKPTPEMRRAMAEAEVGDDVYGEDPTVNRLEQRAAEISKQLLAHRILANAVGPTAIRMLTHCDVDRDGCLRAVETLDRILPRSAAKV